MEVWRDADRQELDRVRRSLGRFGPCRALFDAFLELFAEREGVAVAISGSLASGETDEYSDLDLELIVPDEDQIEPTIAWLTQGAARMGPMLASFPATHLGLRDLRIFFFERENGVVKVDVWVMSAKTFDSMPEMRIVVDPGGWLRARLAAPHRSGVQREYDFADLHNKFTGWIWFTCIKIARGEYGEAANSLEVMRSFALLPCLQFVHGLPYEGYRKLEARLPAEIVASLQATYPAQMRAAELVRALSCLAEMFEAVQPRVSVKLAYDQRTAKLSRMRELLAQWSARYLGRSADSSFNSFEK